VNNLVTRFGVGHHKRYVGQLIPIVVRAYNCEDGVDDRDRYVDKQCETVGATNDVAHVVYNNCFS
jgi:hypothetical protein